MFSRLVVNMYHTRHLLKNELSTDRKPKYQKLRQRNGNYILAILTRVEAMRESPAEESNT